MAERDELHRTEQRHEPDRGPRQPPPPDVTAARARAAVLSPHARRAQVAFASILADHHAGARSETRRPPGRAAGHIVT